MSSFHAFVSYSRLDSPAVLQIVQDLRARHINVWMDQSDILPGQDWDDALVAAMNVCPRFLLFLTPNALASEHVKHELRYAQSKKKVIIPVMLVSCEMPFGLNRKHYANFTRDYQTGLAQLIRTLDEPDQVIGTVNSDGTNTLPPRRRYAGWALGGLATVLVAYFVYTTSAAYRYAVGKRLYDAGKYAEALPLLLLAGGAGQSDAEYILAIMYDEGEGVPPDEDAALAWMRKAVEKNHPLAQCALANLYNLGYYPIRKDTAKADSLFAKALVGLEPLAQTGDLDAQRALGLIYYESRISPNLVEAVRWFTKAAEQNDAVAQSMLGEICLDRQDRKGALHWYQKAAKQGDQQAQQIVRTLEKNTLNLP
jgi:TPR repeat protein